MLYRQRRIYRNSTSRIPGIRTADLYLKRPCPWPHSPKPTPHANLESPAPPSTSSSTRASSVRHLQGHSVFEFNTDESQCVRWLGSQPAASRRNVGMACPPQQPDGGIASRRHHLWDMATAHLRAVFIKRHIADPMGLVLNPPMASDKLQLPLGGGPLGA